MASLYSTNAASGSDPHGSIRSEDGLLDLKLARPCVLCGRDDATNPEQLFAGGYAACFENALLYVTWDAGRRSSDDDCAGCSCHLPVSSAIRGNINVAISASVALSSSSSEESHENNRDNEMKNWDTQKTSLAERLADGRIRVGQDCRGRRSVEFSASGDSVWRPCLSGRRQPETSGRSRRCARQHRSRQGPRSSHDPVRRC
jgi:lipoyl-dependent peroxiredoxin